MERRKRANIILFAIYTSSSITSIGNKALGWRVSIVNEIEADCSRLAHGVREIDSLTRTPSWKCSPSHFYKAQRFSDQWQSTKLSVRYSKFEEAPSSSFLSFLLFLRSATMDVRDTLWPRKTQTVSLAWEWHLQSFRVLGLVCRVGGWPAKKKRCAWYFLSGSGACGHQRPISGVLYLVKCQR